MILFVIIVYIFYRILNPFRWGYYHRPYRPNFFFGPFMYRGMRPRGPFGPMGGPMGGPHHHHHHHGPHHGFRF